MKFEKLNENKIRVTLTAGDLKEKDIDFHDFLSTPLESQDLFLDILEEAKEKIGFNTNNCQVRIEALAMIDGDFIVNVTKLCEIDKASSNTPLNNKTPTLTTPKKKFKVRRKLQSPKSEQVIYKFETFDDYCYFVQFLSQNNLTKSFTIAKKILLYYYQSEYYLIFQNINIENKYVLKFYSVITEFGTYVNGSDLFIAKLKEYGKIALKHNALKTSLKYFEIKKTN